MLGDLDLILRIKSTGWALGYFGDEVIILKDPSDPPGLKSQDEHFVRLVHWLGSSARRTVN